MAEEAKARVDAWEYAYGFTSMRAVRVAIELGLPEVLESHGSPMTLFELSSAVDCPEPSLYRLMRFLSHRGIFKKQQSSQDEVRYERTPLSQLLTKDNMGIYVLVQAGPPNKYNFSITAKDLRAGRGSGLVETAREADGLWQAEEDRGYTDYVNAFRQFLASHGKLTTSNVINNSPETFKGIRSLVDVGGSRGTAMGMLVKAFPWIRGINFDLPQVISMAPPVDGVEHVAGSMFESVPKADAVMLMWILHDWSDELCVKILKKCKEAVPADTGKVIIVEAVIDEEEDDEYTAARLALDMTIMFSTTNGKERTTKEWGQLLNDAGFSRHTIKHMQAVESVIEAYP